MGHLAGRGIVVPIYDTSAPETVATILTTVDARLLFAAGDAPSVDIPVVEIGLGESLAFAYGIEPAAEELQKLDASQGSRDDVASIVFTSGTSGAPQGTTIANRNFVDLVLNVQDAWREVLNEDGRTVIFLPLAHVLARGLQMICLWAGMRVSYLSDPKEVVASLPELQPTFLVIVPRVLEKVVANLRSVAAKAHLGKVWADAEEVAVQWGKHLEEADADSRTSRPPVSLRLRHRLYSALFYRKVRAKLGGKIEFMLSGAAPLDTRLSLMFRGMGIPVMEGYGLTETTAPMAGNRPGRIRSGTVGELVPGTSVKIADDGHILVQGIGVAPGYLDPGTTNAAYRDGWLDTGDLGELSDDGYLTVTGRAKDVIVTSNGKTVSPGAWENDVAADPEIAHAVVVGDRRPYLTALLFLEEGTETMPAGEAESVGDASIRERLTTLVERANGKMSKSEAIKRFQIVRAGMTPESGLVTPTLKVRRQVVIDRFRGLIDKLYAD